LQAGAEWVIETIGLERRLLGADLLVTGEGRLDGQSLRGKAPVAAGRLARRTGVRSVALVGSVGEGWERALGDAFDEVRVIAPPGTPAEEAMHGAAGLIADSAAQLLS
jgi:glycerate kinase